MSDDNNPSGVPPQFDNPEAEVHMTQGEFLRLVNETAKKMGEAATDAQFAVVIGASVTILEQCLRECSPEGRDAVYQNISRSLMVAMNKISLAEAAALEAMPAGQPGTANDEDAEEGAPISPLLMDGPDTLQ